MKKLFLTLLFNILFSASSFAQSIANANYDNNMQGGIKSIEKCWECKLVEGIYTYTFNFAFRMYKILSPIVYTLVLVFLAFWFLWFVWDKVIKGHINFKGGNVFDFLKEIWVKLFTVLFVLTFLSQVPANKMFSYTIDPIISFGAGFGKWILVETRNDNEVMQNYSNAILKNKLPKYNCADIKLSANTESMFRINQVEANDEMNVDTLKNLICITAEYANSYTIGLNLGAKILSRGLIGAAEDYGTKIVMNNVDTFVSFIPKAGWGQLAYWVLKVVITILKVWSTFALMFNLVIACIGLFIMIQFLFVGLTFITMILDIVIQLALVGVMMPIVIGAWAFPDKGVGNLRGKLSGKLFWSVLRCSFRLAFLAVSISITIFLLNELMTTSFETSDQNMLSLYDSLGSSDGLASQGTALNKSSRDFMELIFSNVGILIAMIFTTLVSWMLLKQSIQKADSFSNSLYSGISNDSILNGLKNLTMNTIKYVKSGAKRELDFYMKKENYKDALKINKNMDESQARKSQVQEWKNEIFKEGNTEHLFDVPAEDIVNGYEIIKNYDEKNSEINQNTEAIYPQTKEDSEKTVEIPFAPIAPNIRENQEVLNTLQQPETEFIEKQIASPEYKELPQEQKQEMATAILSNNPEDLENISKEPEVAEMFAKINATPKEDEEITNDKFITSNLIATEAKSVDELSNPMIKLQAVYIRQQIIEEIKTLPKEEQKAIKKFMNLTKKPNLSKQEARMEYEHQKSIYEKLESKVKNDLVLKQKKVLDLIEQRKTLQTYNKLKSNLTAKNVIQAVKNDELNEITAELETINMTDVVKRSYLRRKLKKLEEEIDAISEKDNLELEDEYDSIIDNWRKNKRRNKSRINPNKKI
ncbi:MAG: hypothetical protein IJ638_00085 [Alphaproteobacteria bacterium]|nr:hypothetical protein [Alphaproteobacteria bacterium]